MIQPYRTQYPGRTLGCVSRRRTVLYTIPVGIPLLSLYKNASEIDADVVDVAKVTEVKGNEIHLSTDRLLGVTVKVEIQIEGLKCEAIIDTGAEVTVVSEKMFHSLPESCSLTVEPAERTLVVAGEGNLMKSTGVVHLNISLGAQAFKWPAYIAPIADDFLLGCDMFDAKDMTFNTHLGLQIEEEWIPCDVTRMSEVISRCRVVLKTEVSLPQQSECISPGRAIHPEKVTSQFAAIEPMFEDKRDLIVARALVDTNAEDIPVRLINLSKENITLRKGYLVGELVPVDQIVTLADTKDDIGPGEQGSSVVEAPISQEDKHDQDLKTNVYQIKTDERLANGQLDGSSKFSGVAGTCEVPDHLAELYQKSCESLKNIEHKHMLAQVLTQHSDAFAMNKMDLGTCSLIQHKINTGSAAPIRQPLRRTPKGFEGEEEKYLQQQLATGVFVPSSSAWASPVCLVRKRDNTVRWCVDYRRLNDVTVMDAYPLPRIDTCLDCLSTAKYFSTMDLQQGYWQLTVAERDRPKTAFITKYGLYEYTKLPMGLCSAPSTFQRCMELIFRGLQWKHLLIYLDDLIIYSSNIETHFQHLSEVFGLLKDAGLKLKPAKCHLLQSEVLFLGHIVSSDGLRPNPALIESVKKWEPPKTVKQVQQFMGLCSYYRRFLLRFSETAAPLTELTKKGVPFVWSAQCQQAFVTLKESLCQAPVLAYPCQEGTFILDCDASDVAIGCVLSQIQGDLEKVICYGSKKLAKTQQNYCVTRRELLAVVTFVDQYRHYLLGRKFIVRTDHSSLRWLFNFKEPQGQLARWLEVLSQYQFQIVHRAGKNHSNCDSISRRWTDCEECSCYQYGVSLENLPCGGCRTCTQRDREWSHFHENVDDISDLVIVGSNQTSIEDPMDSRRENNPVCRRMTTRTTAAQPGPSSITSSPTNPVNEDTCSSTPLITKQSTWLEGYTPDQLHRLQQEDDDLAPVYEWKHSGIKPDRDAIACHSPATRKLWINLEMIELIDDVLYQKWLSYDGTLRRLQLLVPKSLRSEILQHCHNSALSGHQGIYKTILKIKQKFYWYRMGEDIKLHIKQCTECAANRQPQKKPTVPLKDYRVGAPLDRVGIDILGPLPISNRGNDYILVIGDYFSRWMESYAINGQTAETVANTLVHEFVCRYGAPLEIHSDQGRAFESVLFQQVCELLEIEKTRSAPYRPSSNGLVERFNGTLGKMLRCFAVNNPTEWDVYLPALTAAYRSTIHPATGYTPNMLMFGREVNLPIELLFPLPAPAEIPDVHAYVANLKLRLEECYTRAREHLKSTSQRQKRDYDTRVLTHTYVPGDYVYRRNPIKKKLEAKWEGPYVILKSFSSAIYQVTGKKKTLILHHDTLKPYTAAFVPSWAEKIRARLQKGKDQEKNN